MKNNRARFYGFTCLSRQNYADYYLPKVEEMDSITFGEYVRNDGCIAEITMKWYQRKDRQEISLEVFDDAVCLLGKPIIQHLFRLLKKVQKDKIVLTPDVFLHLLLSVGFEDTSDNKMQKQ